MEKRVLGRGLNALIQENSGLAKEKVFESKIQQGITIIPIEKIKANKYQPRGDFDNKSIENLSISIKEKGFIQPILVRSGQGCYELIAGERRLRAAKGLKLKEMPAIIKEATDLDSLEISIIENVQRESLNPIDQAKAYKRLSDEFDITQDKIADTIGKDRATVANILRLLKLPQKIQEYVSRGTLSMGHARALLSLSSATEQTRLCTKVMKNDLSVRDTERCAKTWLSPKKKNVSEKDPNLTSIEESLSQVLGTKVKIARSKKGGKIEIEFYSDKELEKIVTLLKSKS